MNALKYVLLVIDMILGFVALGSMYFLDPLIGGWAVPIVIFFIFLFAILAIIIVGSLEEEMYKKPETYEYTMDNNELINLLKNNLQKNKYKLVGSKKNEYVYEKKFFIGTVLGTRICEKLILLEVNKYDDATRERVKKEIDKCVAENKEIKNPSYSKSTQMIIIADTIDFDVNNFYESDFTFYVKCRYGIPEPYGFLIPFVIDKENKRIIISGGRTNGSAFIIQYNEQRNRIVRLFKNYF